LPPDGFRFILFAIAGYADALMRHYLFRFFLRDAYAYCRRCYASAMIIEAALSPCALLQRFRYCHMSWRRHADDFSATPMA